MRPDGDVDFVLGRYDRNQPLIIDPVVEYAGYPGGRGDDIATAIVRGTDGFVYIAGTTLSGDLIVTGDAAQGTRGGDADIFVMKIDPNAHGDEAIAYSTFIGGSGRDELHSMARGADGMLYLAGDTASPNFPVSSGAAQSTLKGDLDAFAIKLDPTQTGTAALVYSTYLGGGGKDAALAAAVGSDGSFVLTGYSGSSDFPLAGTPYQSNVAGGWDIFVAQLGPDGALVYSTLLGGESTDMGEAVAIDREGAIIVGGWTSSPYIQLAGSPYQDFHAGRGDGFVFKLVPALGTSGLVYSTYFGGSEHDEVTAVAVDASGRIVVTGSTLSQDFPTTSGALQAQPKGDSDAFVSVFDAARTGTASLIYSTLLGGSDGDVPLAVKLDAQGHAVITGYTFSSDFRVTPDAQQSKNQGLTDAFLTIIDLAPGAASPLLYSTYIGGPIADIAYGLDIDPTGRIYIAGSTSSRTLAPTQADARTTDPGDRNAFLITLRP
jgi:Beta-propeller repeat